MNGADCDGKRGECWVMNVMDNVWEEVVKIVRILIIVMGLYKDGKGMRE
jgi:hypothetical protein